MITVLGFYYADGKYELKNSVDFLNSREDLFMVLWNKIQKRNTAQKFKK